MVAPEMMVWSCDLLTAGDSCGVCIHDDVVVWNHDTARPGKQNARSENIRAGVGKFR